MRLTLHLRTVVLLFGYRKRKVIKPCVLDLAVSDIEIADEYMGNSDGSEATTSKRQGCEGNLKWYYMVCRGSNSYYILDQGTGNM